MQQLENMSINDLKALAYDCIAQKEEAERNLAVVNQQIMKKLQEKVQINHIEELELVK